MPIARRSLLAILVFGLVFGLVLGVACGRPVDASEDAPAASAFEVDVVTLAPREVTLTRELPARVSARRVAEVRARVDGIVEAQVFTEGTDVEEGQLLYRIEAAPYEAALAAARANLARAEARRVTARLTARRDEALLERNAVSRESHENSAAALDASEAEVAAAKAAMRSAKIDLTYTNVTAPVAGRIGRSEVTEGAYVRRSEATLLATIQQLDSVFVDITQSAAEMLRLRRELEGDRLQGSAADAEVTLVLEDGQPYPEGGTLQFADATVTRSTGSITLRATFPNPRRVLLPGMFVRARIELGTRQNAIVVPQRAVTRDPKGQATVLVVGADDVVERRTFVTEHPIDDGWLVEEGLVAGDRVIVGGLQKVRPGDRVTVAPAASE